MPKRKRAETSAERRKRITRIERQIDEHLAKEARAPHGRQTLSTDEHQDSVGKGRG